jgi:hypothetical protein
MEVRLATEKSEQASSTRHSKPSPRGRFWRLVGIAVAAALLLSLVYTGVSPTETTSATPWSDALCVSSLLLALASGLPFLLDAGRGLMLPNQMSRGKEDRQRRWDEERAKREKGIQITFALGLAAFLVGLFSLLVSLW